jgi:hypothetical protein
VRRDVLNGANVDISFEAPSKEWSTRRSGPALNLYLYDIHEDLQRRGVQFEEIRNERGLVVERRPPPREFKLSYLVTAWTQRPEDEHRLLSAGEDRPVEMADLVRATEREYRKLGRLGVPAEFGPYYPLITGVRVQ